MLFHNYWEKVLGSKVKLKVVRTLCRYPSKRFTIRELASYTKVSHTPVLKSLSDLQGMNLIRLEKHGTANLLTLNQKSYLYPLLSKLFSVESGTKEKMEQRISSLLPPVKMAALFGSIQQRRERLDSDIDLLLVAQDNKKMVQRLTGELRGTITEEFGSYLSPLIFTEEEFKRKKNTPFAKDLVKNYKVLQGKDLIKKWWIHD